jgi:uncharacterized protein YidB (DUF937 family)
MGLLDSIAGALLGGGNQGGMAQVAMEVLNQHGGLSGVLDKLKEGGLADEVASWVGTGANMPVSADQISAALGNSTIGNLASKFGISPEVLSSQIAQHLPELINKATPNGQVTAESGDILSSILGMLK